MGRLGQGLGGWKGLQGKLIHWKLTLWDWKRLNIGPKVSISRVQPASGLMRFKPEELFMRHLYSFYRILEHDPPDPSQLSAVLLRLCSSAAETVFSICDSLHAPDRHKNISRAASSHSLNVVFKGLARSFNHLTRGFDKLLAIPQADRFRGQVIHSLVKLFGQLLDRLQRESIHHSQSQIRQVLKTVDQPEPARVSNQDNSTPPEPKPDICAHLSQLLASLLSNLDPKKPAHTELLEGILYHLLQRAGQTLHAFVFAEKESESEAEAEKRTDAPPTTTEPQPITTDFDTAIKKAATRHEAKYLIWILKKALAFIDANPSCEQPPTNKTDLEDAARTRLQYTLLKAIFGAGRSDFGMGLNLPRDVDSRVEVDTDVPSVSEEETSEWFKRELWMLVGWEVLGRYVDGDGDGDGDLGE